MKSRSSAILIFLFLVPAEVFAVDCKGGPMIFNEVTGKYDCLPIENAVPFKVAPTPEDVPTKKQIDRKNNSEKKNRRNDPKHNRPFAGLDLGAGGDNEQLTLGATFGREQGVYLYGLQISYGLNGDEVPSDLLDYPVPHDNYEELGWQNDGGEYGFLVIGGLEVALDTFVVGGIGQTYQEKVFVAQSNITSWYYSQRTKTDSHGDYYFGLHLRLEGKPSYISIGFQKRRGFVVGFNYAI